MKRLISGLVLLLAIGFISGYAQSVPTLDGTGLTVKNTIQSQAFNMPDETPYGTDTTKMLGSGETSFPSSETGFVYDIMVSDTSITLTFVDIPENAPIARVIEEGTFDRYYLSFDKDIIATAIANTSATLVPNITKVTGTEIEFEVGPGMEVGPGFGITIDLTLK